MKLNIWDTAGLESFRSITRTFYKGSHVVFLVFDITRAGSLVGAIENWIKDISNHINDDTLIYLIGNRCDLDEKREVTKE